MSPDPTLRTCASRVDVSHTSYLWDEVRLPTIGVDEECYLSCYLPCSDSECSCGKICDDNGTPVVYRKECERNLQRLWTRMHSEAHLPRNVDRAQRIAREIPVATSWRHYRGLIEEQKQAIDGNLDVEALEYGMARFPNLMRIKITPATHGYLFTPLCETRLIRSLPCGMNYYTPRGWPTNLARDKDSRVKELVIDACRQPTGISCNIFREPNENYDDFCQVLKLPGFRRLDLPLHLSTAWRYSQDYEGLRSPLLYNVLAAASKLESMHLSTNAEPDPEGYPARVGAASMEHFISLRSILPVAAWPQWRHFGLTEFWSANLTW